MVLFSHDLNLKDRNYLIDIGKLKDALQFYEKVMDKLVYQLPNGPCKVQTMQKHGADVLEGANILLLFWLVEAKRYTRMRILMRFVKNCRATQPNLYSEIDFLY